MILYKEKLFNIMKERGITDPPVTWLRAKGLSPTIVNKLTHNGRVNTDTIDKLCSLLDCQPGDLMEYRTVDNAVDK